MRVADCVGTILLLTLSVHSSALGGLAFTTPVNLGSIINSPFDDGTPNISFDGLALYFASNRPTGDGNKFDIFVATRPALTAPFGPPTPVNEINSTFSDFAPDISPDGLTLFFTSTRNDPRAQGNIWFATRDSRSDLFGTPQLVPNVNSVIDDGGPSISANGLTLFISSLRSGDYDLWQASRPTANDDFGTPTNLGAVVNSAAIDGTPSISADGLTLFFASTRPGGIGPRSLWISTRAAVNVPFGAPTNLGSIVNSDFVDSSPSISSDSKTLYFASNRPDGYGRSDIWVTVATPEPPSAVLLVGLFFGLGCVRRLDCWGAGWAASKCWSVWERATQDDAG